MNGKAEGKKYYGYGKWTRAMSKAVGASGTEKRSFWYLKIQVFWM
jgi:hypothetical protein